MRRSWKQTKELIEARRQDFLNGDASEHVFRASLKALGLLADEVRQEVASALEEKAPPSATLNGRDTASKEWLGHYLKR